MHRSKLSRSCCGSVCKFRRIAQSSSVHRTKSMSAMGHAPETVKILCPHLVHLDCGAVRSPQVAEWRWLQLTDAETGVHSSAREVGVTWWHTLYSMYSILHQTDSQCSWCSQILRVCSNLQSFLCFSHNINKYEPIWIPVSVVTETCTHEKYERFHLTLAVSANYTVNHKKRDILFLTITLANLNRFL